MFAESHFTKGESMYRLLLLDDEEIVLKGIQKVYDMPKYGFQVVGAISNPVKALEQLDILQPDLIITDVKMPQMDGLEFSSEVKKHFPDVEVVILSGYDDFSYAQAAMKLGVSDYLLKPIKKDDFIAMLKHMHQKIEEKQSKENQYQELQELVRNSYSELKNRFYLAVTEDNKYDENLCDALKRHGQIEFTDETFILIKIDTDRVSTEGDYTSEIGKIMQTMEMILSDFGTVLDFWSDESLYFVLYNINEAQYDDVCETVLALGDTQNADAMFDMVGISHIHHGQQELFQARNDCVRQIFMKEANIDYTSEANPVQKKEINLTIPYTEIENLFHAISMNDREGIDGILERIYVETNQNVHVLYRDYVSSISFLILLRIYQMQNRYNAKDEIARQELLDLKYLRREYPGMEEQKKLVKEISLEIAELVSKQKVAAPSKMMQAAMDYINQHYGENISLQDVADNINISKNYLCDIFQKSHGYG